VRRRALALLLSTCLSSQAFAQGAVLQAGPVVPGHVATWARNGAVIDGGTFPTSTGYLSAGALSWDVAISLACALPGDVNILLPPGVLTMAAPVTNCGGRNVRILGAGKGLTTLNVTHSGDVFDVAQTDASQVVDVGDLSIQTTSTSGNPAVLRVSYPLAYNPGTGVYAFSEFHSNFGLHDVAIKSTAPGAGVGGTFCKGTVVAGGWLMKLTNVTMVGQNVHPAPTGCAMLDVSESFDIDLDNPEMTYGDAMVYQSGYAEGIKMQHPVTVGANWVMDQGPGSGFNTRAGYYSNVIWVSDAEINTYSGGFQISHNQALKNTNAHWSRWGAGNETWIGYSMSDVIDTLALGDLFGQGANPSTMTDIQLTAGTASTTSNIFIGARFEVAGATAVNFGAGTAQNNVLDYLADPGIVFTNAGIGNRIIGQSAAGDRQVQVNDYTAGPDGKKLDGVIVVPGAVNYTIRIPGLSGFGPSSECVGTDTNVSCNYVAQGAGGHVFNDGLGTLLQLAPSDANPQISWPGFTSASSGNAVALGPKGVVAGFQVGGNPLYLVGVPACTVVPAGVLAACAGSGGALQAHP
jgi:hypothetical protein